MEEDPKKTERRKQDVRSAMSTAEGRRLLWDIIDTTAGAFRGSFSGDALGTAFNEGRRSVGLDLMVRMQQASTADYTRALNEALVEREFELEAIRKRLAEVSEDD